MLYRRFIDVVDDLKKDKVVYVVKKGARYLTIKCGELRMTAKQAGAICFDDRSVIERFIHNCIADDRNAKVIGNGYAIVPIGNQTALKAAGLA